MLIQEVNTKIFVKNLVKDLREDCIFSKYDLVRIYSVRKLYPRALA